MTAAKTGVAKREKPAPPMRVRIVISQARRSRHEIDMPCASPAQLEVLYAALRECDELAAAEYRACAERVATTEGRS